MEYLKRKKEDSNKYYLFKSGLFYIFLDEDAKYISKTSLLKLTNLNNDIVKCGFPSNSLDKYIELFNKLDLDIEIIDSISSNIDINNKIINKIKNININTLTPVKALNIISDFKDMLSYE